MVEIMGRYRIIDLLSTQLATDEAQNKVIAQQAYDSSRTLDLPADRRDLASCSSFCMGAILESSFSARAFEVLGKQRRLPVLARQLCRGRGPRHADCLRLYSGRTWPKRRALGRRTQACRACGDPCRGAAGGHFPRTPSVFVAGRHTASSLRRTRAPSVTALLHGVQLSGPTQKMAATASYHHVAAGGTSFSRPTLCLQAIVLALNWVSLGHARSPPKHEWVTL